MTPLARAIYAILRRRTPVADPRITYKELAIELRSARAAFENITQRSQALYSALCEVGALCRRLQLAPLPALVVRADSGRPGDAYFEGMPFRFRGERIAHWRRELAAVRATTYPALAKVPKPAATEQSQASPRFGKRLR